MLGFSGNGEGAGLPTMRLAADDAALVTRNPRKRKTPPESVAEGPPQPPQLHHVLPPMIHPMQHPLPPGYPYADFTPGGIPPPPDRQPQSPAPSTPAAAAAAGRALSNSKRAEQNRKAQRAFRERRDQSVPPSSSLHHLTSPRHVKALESRSQLLDAALASADEANRRWEECRALVDQLRLENTALRAALQQAQTLAPHDPGSAAQQQLEEATRSLEAVVSDSLKSESTESTDHKSDQQQP
ncbi:hypothetical protein H2248_005160 [Termitomyces sp. 'cryptogamus']|nr:hypothetical protein H2248_005160 [Termitomyces sp. 'cryptogamus']